MQVALEQARQEAVHFREAKRPSLYHICLPIMGVGGEITDGLAQGNGMLTQNRSYIKTGLP
jgi:hypothetical protein